MSLTRVFDVSHYRWVQPRVSNKVVAAAAKGGAQRSRPPRPRVTWPNEEAASMYLAKRWPKDNGE
jgi:hypothetical protein